MNRSTPLIMTIDDDELINQILEKRLNEMGFISKSYISPQEFLGGVKTLRPDLCIIDINFGEKTIGFLLVQAIRTALDYYVPIIMLSGDSNIESIAYAMELGADDYIVKPPRKDSFENVIKKYLKSDSEVQDAPEIHRVVPADKKKSSVAIDIQMTHISEDGMYISSPTLVTTGVPIMLRGQFVQDVFEAETIQVMVIKNWLIRETGEFGAYVEYFDSSNTLQLAARRYVEGVAAI